MHILGWSKIVKLVQHGFLRAIRLPQQKHIYSIGRAGLPVLVAEGIIMEDLSGRRLWVAELANDYSVDNPDAMFGDICYSPRGLGRRGDDIH